MEESVFQYEHQAMATYFKLVITNDEEDYAKSAADQVFQLIDEMEHRLSRFIPDSEISRINRMKEGDQLPLDYETWEVMKQAFIANQMSEGTFDIGVARHMDVFRAAKQGILNEYEMYNALEKVHQQKGESAFYLDPDKPLIICGNPGMQFDLGGVGKGYALDQVRLKMDELSIASFSLSAGDSTLLLGNDEQTKPHWTYPISAKMEQRVLKLSNCSVSASGTYYQGKHIFDPRTGKNDLEVQYDMVWVCANSAALSDAFSTAAFMLSTDQMETIIKKNDEILWIAYALDGRLHFVGNNAFS